MRKALGGAIGKARHVDEVAAQRLVDDVGGFEQRIGAAKGEDGGVAVVRGNDHRRARRRLGIAQHPAAGYALGTETSENEIGAPVTPELHQGRDVETEARHGNCRIDGATAAVRGDVEGFGLAALLQQQEGGIRVEHRHSFDAIALDDGDRIDHSAADRNSLHHIPLKCSSVVPSIGPHAR